MVSVVTAALVSRSQTLSSIAQYKMEAGGRKGGWATRDYCCTRTHARAHTHTQVDGNENGYMRYRAGVRQSITCRVEFIGCWVLEEILTEAIVLVSLKVLVAI